MILHSFYIVKTIFFHHPTNLFTQLNVPFVTPSPLLREALLVTHPESIGLPDTTEALLSRLQSLDARSLYVRFGHDTVELCDYCHSFADFALFALPATTLTYLRTIVIVGLMTMKGSGKRRWRSWGVGILVVAAAIEAWILVTVDIQFYPENRRVVMWHDRAWLLRHYLFLLLPVGIHSLPYGYGPLAPLAALPATLHSLERTLNSLQALEHLQAAALRNEGTRETIDKYWSEQSRLGQIMRESEDIRGEARRVGISFGSHGIDESPLMTLARDIVQRWKLVMASSVDQQPDG